MKFLLVVVLLILGIVLYVAFGPGGDDKTANTPTQAEQAASNHPKSDTSLKEDVNSAINYGIGATQLKAKKHMSNKLDKINSGHTKELDEKLAE
jgi:hypothetical protein